MSFQTPITVKEAVDNVHAKKYLLPAIQRELVWDAPQIERLFDSLMRDYPVGSFLFWHVDKRKAHEFQFYEFIRDYHERDRKHNPKADVTGEDDITAILDGQQRLTALYIGLRGTYAYKEHMKRWDNPAAFPQRKLYLNLLKKYSDEDEEGLDLEYDFYFLADKEAQDKKDDDHYWFRVGDVLQFGKQFEVNSYLIKNGLMALPDGKAEFANQTLFKLYSVIHEERVVNYFLEKGEELDKVLNIFVRVNSGGTTLSHSDLLLSIASASWKERDAREEITKFVDDINGVRNGFNFNKDFVLKTCLVLGDFPDIAFKVDNFNKRNMLTIENKWEEITEAVRLTVDLVASFGYNRDTLASNNALIPLAYYLLKAGSPHNFVYASEFKEDRGRIQKWLVASLLKRAFSGTPDNVLRPIRKVIDKNHDGFPLEQIVEEFRGGTKSIAFNGDEIQNLFLYYYGSPYTFSTLAVLYPTLDFKNRFHLDHIHPRSSFKKRSLLKRDIAESRIGFYLDEVDYLANLQLLDGAENIEKRDKDFKDWLEQTCPTPQARRDFMAKHYIPEVDLSLTNFEQFVAERKKLMTAKFESILRLESARGRDSS
jgi:uncharacterized protein with ParB-like and HNH nuclease domain